MSFSPLHSTIGFPASVLVLSPVLEAKKQPQTHDNAMHVFLAPARMLNLSPSRLPLQSDFTPGAFRRAPEGTQRVLSPFPGSLQRALATPQSPRAGRPGTRVRSAGTDALPVTHVLLPQPSRAASFTQPGVI